MLSYEIQPDPGVVIIEPSGPLRESDFQELSKDVDLYLDKKGTLKGIIIHAKSFPGWEDFAAFISHMKFIKEHHRKIKRVAAVIDGALMSILPGIADHFVSAEVKHFAYDEMKSAMDWIINYKK